jgi:tRNA (guanine26-N2/guanine27-N2)-dimethyltransferase
MSASTVTEGLGKLLKPVGNKVFYNHAQVINRDISIAMIQAYVNHKKQGLYPRTRKMDSFEPVRILEALSASGIRAIRYHKEIDGVQCVVANDVDPVAVEMIQKNLELNDIPDGSVITSCSDAITLLEDVRRGAIENPELLFDVIDLDPYGTVGPFLDPAIRAVSNNGLLCVTSTDMRNLVGAIPESCFGLHGSMPIRTRFSTEMALRIILYAMQMAAGKQKKVIEPLLSLSIDFYVRLFVRVRSSPLEAQMSAKNIAVVFECMKCGSYALQPFGTFPQNAGAKKASPAFGPPVGPLCQFCGGQHRMGGPIYSGPIHNGSFLKEAQKTMTQLSKSGNYGVRSSGLIDAASLELPDTPLFYELPRLCSFLKTTVPPLNLFRAAVENCGYRFSGTHASPTAFKTDAPMQVIWDVLRDWVLRKETAVNKLQPEDPGYKVLHNTEGRYFDQVDWTPRQKYQKSPRGIYQNPEAHWGPLSKAGVHKKTVKHPSSKEKVTNEEKRHPRRLSDHLSDEALEEMKLTRDQVESAEVLVQKLQLEVEGSRSEMGRYVQLTKMFQWMIQQRRTEKLAARYNLNEQRKGQCLGCHKFLAPSTLMRHASPRSKECHDAKVKELVDALDAFSTLSKADSKTD